MAGRNKPREFDQHNSPHDTDPVGNSPSRHARRTPVARDNLGTARGIDHALMDQFGWHVIAIQNHLQTIRGIFARAIGITGPQFLILTAIKDIDRDKGVSVSDVSNRLLVDPSFVTTQSKVLEKLGLVRRKPSTADARVVLMSLTDQARKQIASLSSLQEYSDSLVFAGWTNDSLRDIVEKLGGLSQRLSRSAVIISTEI